MSVQPRRLSSGRVVYDVRLRDPLGRHYKRTFKTKREAQTFEASERSDRASGDWIDPLGGKILLAHYASTWLKTRVNLRIRTRELYEGLLRLHVLPALGNRCIGELSTATVRTWYASLFDKGLQQSTCAKAYRLLRTILGTAVEDGLIAKNPCSIKGAGVARSLERPIASVAEVLALAEAIEPQLRVAVLLATFAGLRLGEILALTQERIDFDEATVAVVEQLQELADGGYVTGPPKSDAGRRVVSLPNFMMDELRWHLAKYVEPRSNGRLFNGSRGGPLRRAVFQRAWNAARLAVGVEHLHFHDLRHTGNTLAAATGASTKELMSRMGHSSSDAALRYQHATRSRDVVIAAGLNRLVGELQASQVSPSHDDRVSGSSNVASLDEKRDARSGIMARYARHERAMELEKTSGPSEEWTPDQEELESGRRESNPRSQLGKLMFCR